MRMLGSTGNDCQAALDRARTVVSTVWRTPL
jgi:hypothetical protein